MWLWLGFDLRLLCVYDYVMWCWGIELVILDGLFGFDLTDIVCCFV